MPCPHAVTSKVLPAATQMKDKKNSTRETGFWYINQYEKGKAESSGISYHSHPLPQPYTHKTSISDADYCIYSEALEYCPIFPNGLCSTLYFTLT